MYNRAIVIMTALVPTQGHTDLIKFAEQIANNVTVIIQARSFEPISGIDRLEAISEQISDTSSIYLDYDDYAPQTPNPTLEISPGSDTEFWNYWRDNILKYIDTANSNDVVVASEPYGAVLAQYLGCKFVPFDCDRIFNDDKGTNIRNNIINKWNSILPYTREQLQTNVVLFGQESVGKTTLGKQLQAGWPKMFRYIPEYARGYLETVGTEVTLDKMRVIEIGQNAIQNMAMQQAKTPVNVFDTDLLSTLGYYRIMFDNKVPNMMTDVSMQQINLLREQTIYVLLPDDIPFEPDPLRYGGDRRESSYQFWKDLLDEYKMNYLEVPRVISWNRHIFVYQQIKEHIFNDNSKIGKLINFKRD